MSHSASFPIGTEGATIPAMGFGTFQPDNNPEAGVTEAVLRALEAGYQHIDTAWMYGNGEAERGVGKALRRWNGKREDVFIVTKLANAHHNPVDVALLENDLIKYCNENGIHVTAFSPLGGKPVGAVTANADVPGPLHNEVIQSVAEKHGMTAAQVLLKWGLQRGTSVIPKAYTPSHIVDNFAVLALPDLPAEDCRAIDEIRKDQGEVRFINYLTHWGFDIFRPGPEDPTEQS